MHSRAAVLLPKMTDPLGRHWSQPKGLRDRVQLFETHALISEADWLALPRYERSAPSGVYPGKAWRHGKWLCWYGPDRGGCCRVGFLRALVTL